MQRDYIRNEAFNQDPVVSYEVERLAKEFRPKHIIETGTHEARTAMWLASVKDANLYTIEVNQEFYNISKQKLSDFSNAQIILGSSEQVLPQLLPKLVKDDEYILFYMDAHWFGDLPLQKEIEIISQYCKNRALIIVDDFEVPNRDFAFDQYGDKKINLKLIEKQLSQVNDFDHPYIAYFNDFSLRAGRTVGKLYYVPKTAGTMKFVKEETVFFSNLNASNLQNDA